MEELASEGIDGELIWIGAENLRGCIACGKCRENQNKKCVQTGDKMNEYIGKIIDADGVVLGSPTYFADLTTNIKALIERVGYVCRGNGNLLKRKIGAAVVAVRRAGSLPVFDAINHFYFINQVIVPGSSYWNMGIGLDKNDVDNDEEGIQTMKNLGSNMAWLLKKINA